MDLTAGLKNSEIGLAKETKPGLERKKAWVLAVEDGRA